MVCLAVCGRTGRLVGFQERLDAVALQWLGEVAQAATGVRDRPGWTHAGGRSLRCLEVGVAGWIEAGPVSAPEKAFDSGIPGEPPTLRQQQPWIVKR